MEPTPPRASDRLANAPALKALALLAALTAAGTLGFMWVEELDFVDALYMSVITLSTVGYQDVAPRSVEGRLFTVAFIVVGVGGALYALGSVAAGLIEGRVRDVLGRRSMDRTLKTLHGHVIVCGFGRLGRAVVEELEKQGTPLVVIEADPSRAPANAGTGTPHVAGSALEEGVLREAGIERAAAIVLAMGSDPDNVFAALSARELNPRIAVHARAETEPGVRRLRLAGAHQVISIHHLGGRRIANAIVRPAVVDFLELAAPGGGAAIDLEEVVLAEGSPLAGLRLRDLPSRGVRVSVVAIRHAGEALRLAPGADDVLAAGDHVVVVGDRANVEKLAARAVAD